MLGLGVLEVVGVSLRGIGGDMYLEDRREAGGSVDRMIYLDRSLGGCRREDAVGRILPIGVTTVTVSWSRINVYM